MEDEKNEEMAEENQPEEATEAADTGADEGYQFDDDLSASEPAPAASSSFDRESTGSAPRRDGQGGHFADEIYSKTIHAKLRTFYVDLKESSNGKFIKVSEKSRGRKSTIMMDAEDLPEMITALQEVQQQL